MRIGIDYRPAQKKNSRRRGIGKYTHQLVHALLETNPGHDILLYSLKGSTVDLTGKFQARGIFYLHRPGRLNWVVDWLLLPYHLNGDGLDLFHYTDALSLPPRKRCRAVVTVYDLIPLVFKEETRRSVPRDFLWVLERAYDKLQQADSIVTISSFSAHDIVNRLGIDRELVHVIYPGSNPILGAVEPSQARRLVAERYGLRHPFLFYVGGTDFRKNLTRLIDFFARICEQGFAGDLVLAGETFQFSIPEVLRLQRQICQNDLEDRIKFPGYVPDEHLSWFYSGAICFIFPSLYEGFGLPLLEAMKCGAPALTSSASCLPEIGGDAALYFDPEDVASMVSTFFELYESPRLAAQMKSRGMARARRFTWENTAAQTYQLYARLIEGQASAR